MKWVLIFVLILLVSCTVPKETVELEWEINSENESESPMINKTFIAPEKNETPEINDTPKNMTPPELGDIIEVNTNEKVLTGARFYLGTKFGSFHMVLPDQNTALLNISDNLYQIEMLLVGEGSSRVNKAMFAVNGERVGVLGEKEVGYFGEKEFIYVMEVFYRE